MLEKKIEKIVCNYAESKNILCYKFISPTNKGVPDRLFITEKGFCFFIEFKRKGKKASILQDSNIQRLRKHKALVFLVDDVELGKTIIDNIIQK